MVVYSFTSNIVLIMLVEIFYTAICIQYTSIIIMMKDYSYMHTCMMCMNNYTMYMLFKYRLNTDSPNCRESPIPSLLSLLLELLGKRAEQLLQPITVEV